MTLIEHPLSTSDRTTAGTSDHTTDIAARLVNGLSLGTTICGIADDAPMSATPSVRLPRRFDVHQIDAVVADVRSSAAGYVLLDGSAVEMIDLAAVEALVRLSTEVGTQLTAPSVALQATLRFTGYHDLADGATAVHGYDQAA